MRCRDTVMSHMVEGAPDRLELAGLSDSELRAAVIQLCALGLLTCTSGNPGGAGSTYAACWLPLAEPERHSQAVRDQHAANMAKFRERTQ